MTDVFLGSQKSASALKAKGTVRSQRGKNPGKGNQKEQWKLGQLRVVCCQNKKTGGYWALAVMLVGILAQNRGR